MIGAQSILLVEDSKGDEILAKLEMQRMGFNMDSVDVARTLEQARTLLSVKKYDIVFLDYMIVGERSTGLLDEIDTAKTNVVILSGYKDPDEIAAYCSKPVTATIEKPLREEKLNEYFNELKIEKKVKKRVRAICIAFWSIVSVIAGSIGAFITDHSIAVKAGFRTFIDIWLAK